MFGVEKDLNAFIADYRRLNASLICNVKRSFAQIGKYRRKK